MKNILVTTVALFLSSMAIGQVKFNLSLEQTTKVYTLSIIPDVTWDSPKNLVNSAQIVLRLDAANDFIPGITSLINGLTWADNAYVEQPAGAPDYKFVCISLVNGPTAQIPMVAGQETPLFSFVNTGSECAGKVTLLANDDPMVQVVRAAGYNITQHLGVLGAFGNAFAGVVNNEVDCSPATGVNEANNNVIDEVKVSPVPADKVVDIQWTMLSEQPGLRQLVICDAQGREVFREKIADGKGQHSLKVNVQNWQAGLYRFRFVFDRQHQTQSWNMMVIH